MELMGVGHVEVRVQGLPWDHDALYYAMFHI